MKQGKRLSDNTLNNTVRDHIRTGHNVVAVPRLVADWNYNCYVEATAAHVPAEDTNGFDVDQFPISSIVEANRPNKGIIKAIVGQATVSKGYNSTKKPRFYIGDRDDNYKYWVSQTRTNISGTFTDPVRPTVTYARPVKANKIVIRTENTWATPSNYQISIKAASGDASWTVIGGTSPAIASDGTITLYYVGGSTGWSSTKPATPHPTPPNVQAIMFYCIALSGGKDRTNSSTTYVKRPNNTGKLTSYVTNGSFSNLSLIAIEAHLEVDFTDRLISTSDNFDLGESTQIQPIGHITTNQADISLDNTDQVLNIDNSSSLFYEMMDGNVNFNLEYIYTIAGVDYSVQQFNMYAANWGWSSDDIVSVQLDDISKILKEIKPQKFMLENKTVWEIVASVLDSVGFSSYSIDESDVATNFTVPVFWTTGDSTVWEVLEDLARASQSAMFVDSYGVLQIKTRDAAFADTTPVWTIRGDTSGNELEDLVEINRQNEWEANKVKVSYRATKWRMGTETRIPGQVKVWEPTGDVVLRATQLRSNMNATQTYFVISPDAAKTWPYKGKVRIEGEVLDFEGKEYAYINPSGIWRKTVIVSDDNLKRVKDIGDFPEKGYFTGGVVITKRGLWDTSASAHRIDAGGYGILRETNTSATTSTFSSRVGSSFSHDTRNSLVGLSSTSVADTVVAYTNSQHSTGFIWYGTRFKLGGDSARTTSRAGIVTNMNGTGNNGYYIDVKPSDLLTSDERKVRNEVVVYSKKGNTWHIVKSSQPLAIAKNIWYDLDVHVNGGMITVYLDGRVVVNQGLTNGTTVQPDSGKLGMYVKGRANAYFEYLYGVGEGGFKTEPLDDFGFLDLKTGGIRSGFYNREIVYKKKTRYIKLPNGSRKAQQYLQNVFFFDEFGPFIHEIREFDVEFDPFPAQYSNVYSTNESDATVIQYNSTPMGAKFVIANTARHNAVLNGEDTINTSNDSPINQVLTVLGRDLDIAEDETVEKKNTLAIKKRGVIEAEISSDWIQTKTMAEELATWIAKHWSRGQEEEEVTIFGNPLIEVGDVVAVDYANMNMVAATHKYFVVATSTKFNNGPETNLRLRRIRLATASEVS